MPELLVPYQSISPVGVMFRFAFKVVLLGFTDTAVLLVLTRLEVVAPVDALTISAAPWRRSCPSSYR